MPRGPVCRPREAFAAGEGHLALGAMVTGGSKHPDVEVASCLAFESDVEIAVEMCTQKLRQIGCLGRAPSSVRLIALGATFL